MPKNNNIIIVMTIIIIMIILIIMADREGTDDVFESVELSRLGSPGSDWVF